MHYYKADETVSYLFGNDCNTYCHSKTTTVHLLKLSNSAEQTLINFIPITQLFHSILYQTYFVVT